jgi:outer membrane protein insertion porin family
MRRVQILVVVAASLAATRDASAQEPPAAAPDTQPAAAPDTQPAAPDAQPEAPPAAAPLCKVDNSAGADSLPTTGLASGEPLAGYELKGDFPAEHESAADLRAVLDPLLPAGAAYGPEREVCVLQLLNKLRYRWTVKGTHRAGGLFLSFRLHPALQVRRVAVDIDFPFFIRPPAPYGWLFFPPVLKDDIKARLRYREGTMLPDDDTERARVLDDEARRLAEWMALQGFFEARVSITADEENEYEAALSVEIKPGHEYLLGKVTFEGNTSIPDEDLLALVDDKTLVFWKGRFTKDRLNTWLDKIRAKYHADGFYGVTVKSDFNPSYSFDRATHRVNLKITIKENKKLDTAFEGNDSIAQETLEKFLLFDDENSFDDFAAQDSADAIRAKYWHDGFYQASVSWERVRLLKNFERVIFTIDEGPKQKVKSVTFRGNHDVATVKLEGKVRTRPYSTVGVGDTGGYVTPRQLEDDRRSLIDYYRSQGYSSAQVVARVAPRPELFEDGGALAATVTAEQLKGGLYIRFDIDEGPRDTTGVVEFVNNRAVNDAELATAVKTRVDGPFFPDDMEADGKKIATIYAERGYPYARVSSSFSLLDPSRPGRYRVRFTIDEGEQVHVGKVLVRGNFRTRTWVIRDVLGLHEGQTLTIAALRRGNEELNATGLFSSAQFDLIGIDDEQQYAIVHPFVEVQERYDNHGDIQGGVGYRTDAGFIASLSGAYRNISGVGASASVTGLATVAAPFSGNFARYEGEANLRLPYWLMRRGVLVPLDLNLKLFLNQRDSELFGVLVSGGATASLSRLINRRFRISFNYSFVYRSFDQPLVRAAGSSQELSTTPVPISASSVGVSMVLDRRTDRHGSQALLVAEKGYKIGLTADWATSALGGSEDFLKFGAEGTFFTLLDKRKRFLLQNAIRYDHGVPLGADVLLPETERYFAGGSTTIRGLEEDHAYTEVIRQTLQPGGGLYTTVVRPAGGNIRFIYNIDLQMRVTDWLASAVFFDTGVVMNSFAGFTPSRLRHSVGIALVRILLPIMSVSVDYAIPLDPGPGDDKTGRVHVDISFPASI